MFIFIKSRLDLTTEEKLRREDIPFVNILNITDDVLPLYERQSSNPGSVSN